MQKKVHLINCTTLSANNNNPNDYLTYDLGAVRRITALRTKPRNGQYLRTYHVTYWNVGQDTWTGILDDSGNNIVRTSST